MHYNVLIVDDMPVNRKLMKKVLEKSVEEVTFYEAEDGFEAMERLEKKEIDLIILDLMMPGKDGYQVLREIKENENLKDIPVIVNSAVDDMASIKETLGLGAIDYFTKPITPDQMKIIIPLKVHNALKFFEQKKELQRANTRMMQEMKIATALQKTLITGKQELNKVRVTSKYIPSSQIGGDFHDCIENDEKVWFMIADVTGHGVAAAMVSSMVKVIFNHVVQESRSPKAVLQQINHTFYHMMGDNRHLCFSAFVGLIEKERLTYANAGHPYPGLYRSRIGEVESLELNGFLIGVFDDTDYADVSTEITPGDYIIAYTDGLYETRQDEGGSTNSHETVFEQMKKHKKLIPQNQDSFMKAMIQSFGKFEDGDFEDDVALMMIEVKS
jgi:phosphoserine phosphatase RsbU/P